jgi:hypothetical protein
MLRHTLSRHAEVVRQQSPAGANSIEGRSHSKSHLLMLIQKAAALIEGHTLRGGEKQAPWEGGGHPCRDEGGQW